MIRIKILSERDLPILTRRLSLRRLRSDDFNAEYVNALNDIDHMRFSTQSLMSHSIATQKEYVSTFTEVAHELLAITLRGSHELVDTLTLRSVDANTGVDVGIFLLPRFTNRGFAREAWIDVVHQLGQRFEWVSGGCAKSNMAMVSIMESAKMTLVREETDMLSLKYGREDVVFYRYFRNQLIDSSRDDLP